MNVEESMRSILGALAASTLLAAPIAAVAAEKSFDLPPFTGISISSGIDAVVIVGDAAQSVVASSPRQEELDDLKVEVRDGRLHVWRDFNLFGIFDFGAEPQTIVTIAAPELTSASADSGADIGVTGVSGDAVSLNASSGSDIDARAAAGTSFDLNASSGANLTVEGTCQSARIVASSGASLRADRLLCADVDANASSGSDIDAHASGAFKGNASSGSDISVAGNPAGREVETSSGADINFD
jgi:hypothetical protein